MNNLLNKIIDNDKDKQIILDEINKLSPEQQNFIHQESDTLLELNNEIELLLKDNNLDFLNFMNNLYKLQKNILFYYIKKYVSIDCTELINKYLELYNSKMSVVNRILEDKNKRIIKKKEINTSFIFIF